MSRIETCGTASLARVAWHILPEEAESTLQQTERRCDVFTQFGYEGVWELAKRPSVYACLLKQHPTREVLDRAIQHAIALVGLIPKEDRLRPMSSLSAEQPFQHTKKATQYSDEAFAISPRAIPSL